MPCPYGCSVQNFLASFRELSKLAFEMSKGSSGDGSWAQMTEGQKLESVFSGHATLKQISEGLLDGSDQLRKACREFLAETGASFENLPVESQPHITEHEDRNTPQSSDFFQHPISKRRTRVAAPLKQRFGLPEGFVPRLQRYGRSVLLELNLYRLPNGNEFIPGRPVGTLGARRHLYALLTEEQYLKGKRGSVYIRTDGRIFDYSVDGANAASELFDTGYTIYDLERTGRYAPELRRRKKQRRQTKVKRPARNLSEPPA